MARSSSSGMENSLDSRQLSLGNYLFKRVERDSRPHIEVGIYGVEFCFLLDLGASHSVVGGIGWDMLKYIQRVQIAVTNESTCKPLGRVNFLICLEGEVCVIKCLVVTEMAISIVLEIDVRHKLEASLNFGTNLCEWGKMWPCEDIIAIYGRHNRPIWSEG